jgi:hypothetical protein
MSTPKHFMLSKKPKKSGFSLFLERFLQPEVFIDNIDSALLKTLKETNIIKDINRLGEMDDNPFMELCDKVNTSSVAEISFENTSFDDFYKKLSSISTINKSNIDIDRDFFLKVRRIIMEIRRLSIAEFNFNTMEVYGSLLYLSEMKNYKPSFRNKSSFLEPAKKSLEIIQSLPQKKIETIYMSLDSPVDIRMISIEEFKNIARNLDIDSFFKQAPSDKFSEFFGIINVLLVEYYSTKKASISSEKYLTKIRALRAMHNWVNLMEESSEFNKTFKSIQNTEQKDLIERALRIGFNYGLTFSYISKQDKPLNEAVRGSLSGKDINEKHKPLNTRYAQCIKMAKKYWENKGIMNHSELADLFMDEADYVDTVIVKVKGERVEKHRLMTRKTLMKYLAKVAPENRVFGIKSVNKRSFDHPRTGDENILKGSFNELVDERKRTNFDKTAKSRLKEVAYVSVDLKGEDALPKLK